MPSINSLEGIPAKIIAWHQELIELQTNRDGSCWIWTKSLNWDGYAHTSLGGKSISVHRVSYLIHKGDIPAGMVVRHCCPGGENRACVNPDHLYLGSHQDNMLDRAQRRRVKTQKLSVKDVLAIRDLRMNGATCQEIANKFHISNGHASAVSRRLHHARD